MKPENKLTTEAGTRWPPYNFINYIYQLNCYEQNAARKLDVFQMNVN